MAEAYRRGAPRVDDPPGDHWTPDRSAFRTFSCAIWPSESAAPATSLILAEDESRARLLARRMFLADGSPRSVEIRENGKLLAIELPQIAMSLRIVPQSADG
jgi:hypothetical protein